MVTAAAFGEQNTILARAKVITPPLELAGQACAGCLSFELSSGREPLLVNAGMPGARDASRRPAKPATSASASAASMLCSNSPQS